jgi:hypothetical protein
VYDLNTLLKQILQSCTVYIYISLYTPDISEVQSIFKCTSMYKKKVYKILTYNDV